MLPADDPVAAGQSRHAVGARVVRVPLGRAEDAADGAPEEVVAVRLVRGRLLDVVLLVPHVYELGHRGQGAAAARLWRDVEALHQPTLLLTVLLATHTYG